MPTPIDPKNVEHQALQAFDVLPLRYYEALAAAKVANATQTAIDTYVKEGAALIEVNCLRWFHRIAEVQRRVELADTNRNVITALGTALIGVARLHSDVTAAYGSANTAIAGFNANLSTAYLAAPTAESVKRLTMQAVKARGDLLKNSSSPLYPKDFSSAYAELEKLADVCTYAEVKRLATQSVDQGKPQVDPQTGELSVVASIAPLAADLIATKDSLTCSVGKLGSRDLKSAQNAVLATNPKAQVGSTLNDVQEQLQDEVRNARTQSRIVELGKVFKDAGLDLCR
jgi:hypothetical protein